MGPCTIICGQSNSGKTVVLNNLLKHKLLHEYKPEDIYIFSQTVKGDLNYWPVLLYIANKDIKPKIFDNVDFKTINEIISK